MTDSTDIKVGGIYWVDLNDTIGNEQKGRRPAVVIAKHSETFLCMVIPMTSQDVSRYSYTQLIRKTNRNGLLQDSYAMIFQTRTINTKRIRNQIGMIDDIDFMSILKQLYDYLKLNT
ncbi:MAG: type II toxin-antitoxin system PemK/MazF family toxin [Caldisphaera sp.]